MDFIFFILIGFGVWIIILTIATIKIYSFFSKLSADIKKDNLIAILEEVLQKEKLNAVEIGKIKKYLVEFEEHSLSHVQKIGHVRFNPFEEVGGDHSFAVAILDGLDSGLIITGLHTRERTRVYVKNISKGKAKIDLSKEEKKALSQALKQNER
jgi:hypothetical protein